MTTLRLIGGQDQAAAPGHPVPRSADAHHQLGEYHAYAAIAAVMGPDVATEETGAPLHVHAARLAAVLGELLAENAALRVIAAEVLP
jgi:hypothetical protein